MSFAVLNAIDFFSEIVVPFFIAFNCLSTAQERFTAVGLVAFSFSPASNINSSNELSSGASIVAM